MADILVIIGTSLNVYPAASLLQYTSVPTYVIDPADVDISDYHGVTHIKETVSVGMKKLIEILKKDE